MVLIVVIQKMALLATYILLTTISYGFATENGENIALRKPVLQSTTYRQYNASKAVDGNANQNISFDSCSHTAPKQKQAWWQVDLGAKYHINRVEIFNRRGDLQSRRLKGFKIYVTVENRISGVSYIPRRKKLCYEDKSDESAKTYQNITCSQQKNTGRYVTLYNSENYIGVFLELCEVKVYGRPIGQFCNETCPGNCRFRELRKCNGCKRNWYGNNCTKSCVGCYDGSCAQKKGYCAYGKCKSTFYGKSSSGSLLCNQNCSRNCNGGMCDEVTGKCKGCVAGYFGSFCNMTCPDNCKSRICHQDLGNCSGCEKNWYGFNCTESCSGCYNGTCNQDTAICSEDRCKSTFYGQLSGSSSLLCNQNCSSNCKEKMCNKQTGKCEGCVTGYFGSLCNRSCPYNCKSRICRQDGGKCSGCEQNWYGFNCTESCSGCYKGRCNQDTAFCSLDECRPTFYGSSSDGSSSLICNKNCSSNCKEKTCNERTGQCKECVAGSFGSLCNRKCPDNCKSRICRQDAGRCSGCEQNWYGFNCTASCNGCYEGRCNQDTAFCSARRCKSTFYGSSSDGSSSLICNKNCSSNCKKKKCNERTGKCKECFDGHYGDVCEQNCSSGCKDLICHQEDGTCVSCKTGLYGRYCNQSCSNCLDGKCERNGTCISGCKDGYYGDMCIDECDTRCKNRLCFRTGDCKECNDGHYGDVCEQNCSSGCKDLICHQEDGTCYSCKTGLYGLYCNRTCSNCLDGKCERNGTCISGCKDGYYGDMCIDECDTRCKNRLCFRTGDCKECDEGFYGAVCETRCPDGCSGEGCSQQGGECVSCVGGFRGTFCKHPCSEGCKSSCNQSSGECIDGCNDGYKGPYCQECSPFSYGKDCQLNCGHCLRNETCYFVNGTCLNGCEDTWTGIRCNERILQQHTTMENGGVISAVVIVIIITIVIIVLVIVLYKRRRENKNKIPSSHELNHRQERPQPRFRDRKRESNGEVGPLTESTECINISDLQRIINQKKERNEFEEEYKSFPKGAVYPNISAELPDNKVLNRYLTTFPYDHSRVVLTDRSGPDYINANYIDSIDDENAYIATQGPKKNTKTDFWRMVWQVKSGNIVMLTNLVENLKIKCEQYWPDESNPLHLGRFLIKLQHEEEFAFYIIRTIRIVDKKTTECRSVEHFHFTKWPDHGVPDKTELLLFHRRYMHTQTNQQGPSIIHCSAGIGRTGTFIGLDVLYKYGLENGSVNICEYVRTMRKNRMDMVQTLDQYTFLHDVVLESFEYNTTCISYEEFLGLWQNDKNMAVKKRRTKKEFEVIDTGRPNYGHHDYESARKTENKNKNRSQHILPLEKYRVYLISQESSRTNYINAITLPSVKQLTGYHVTHYPLHNTIIDFWCMVFDQESRTLVTLDDICAKDKDLEWYPKDCQRLTFGPFAVQRLSITAEYKNVKETQLKLIHMENKEELVLKLFEISDWSHGKHVPLTRSSLLQLVDVVELWSVKIERCPITVVCSDGALGCGLFCATNNLIHQLKYEREINVAAMVSRLQSRRPQFIYDYEQYQFLYEVVEEYLESANVYVN